MSNKAALFCYQTFNHTLVDENSGLSIRTLEFNVNCVAFYNSAIQLDQHTLKNANNEAPSRTRCQRATRVKADVFCLHYMFFWKD
jgi:hypothetical protein